jgi:hypothetical protein
MAETWRERINRARERPGFLAADRARASRWQTCAVGELLSRGRLKVARLRNGCPLNAKLRRFGTAFFAAVLANDVARAEAILAEIESIVLELTSRRASPAASGRRASPLRTQEEQNGNTMASRPLQAPAAR